MERVVGGRNRRRRIDRLGRREGEVRGEGVVRERTSQRGKPEIYRDRDCAYATSSQQ